MRIRSQQSQQGIALIIVMVVVLVLGVMAAGFAKFMKVEMRLMQRSNFDDQLEWIGRSGVELARLVLMERQKGIAMENYDALNQKWAGGAGATNELPEISLENVELGGGTFTVKIKDAERKMNINRAAINPALQPVLQNAMIIMGVDAGESQIIVDSIRDWIDNDSNEGIMGAEDKYYLQYPERNYVAKNGPVDDMAELRLVRGIFENPAILWGSSSNSALRAQTTPFDRDEPLPQYAYGLNELFTPVSNGKININTAKAEALQLVPGVTPDVAYAIVQSRAGLDGTDGTEDDLPFRSASELNGRNIPGLGVGTDARQLEQFFTTQSRVFEVEVQAQIGGFQRTYYALIDRPTRAKVLKFYWTSENGEQISRPVSQEEDFPPPEF